MTEKKLAGGKTVRFDELNIGDVFSFDAGNGFGCIGVRRDTTSDGVVRNSVYTDGEGGTINGFFTPEIEVELLVPARGPDA